MAVSLTYGVDVGATSVKAAAVTPNGRIVAEAQLGTPLDSSDAVARTIEESVSAVRAKAPGGVSIGVGTPGWTSADRRRVVYSPNLPWREEPLADRLEMFTGLPVVLENDANAAAWAEFRFGGARSATSMVALTLGSGVGSAIVVGGRLLRGAHGCAGEIGHCVIVTGGLPCACGRIGCMENYCSGRSIDRDAVDVLGSGVSVHEAAREGGDPRARSIYRAFGRRIGRGLANICLTVDPELVVIGGGASESFEWFGEAMRTALLDELGPHWAGIAPDIVAAELGTSAGRVGAADLARQAT